MRPSHTAAKRPLPSARPRHGKFVGAVVAAALALLASPAAGSASSIVYTAAGNVWLMQPDGSGKYQVTLDGTVANPYSSASQADDGRILAQRADHFVLLAQNGAVLGTVSPFGGAQHAAISPDGSAVAYASPCFVSASASTCVTYQNVATGAEVGSSGSGQSFPSWIDSTLTVIGKGGALWLQRLGSSETRWLSPPYTDGVPPFNQPGVALEDAEINAATNRVVALYQGNPQTILLYQGAAPPPAPAGEALCALSGAVGAYDDPTWSPDGAALAWAESDGIHALAVGDVASGCVGSTPATLLAAGGFRPDWGPADVNPGPRPTTTPGGGGGTQPGGGGTQPGGGGTQPGDDGATLDQIAPSASRPALRRARGRSSITFTLSERAMVSALVDRIRSSGRVVRVRTVTRRVLPAGRTVLALGSLRPGRFRVTLLLRDDAGNTGRLVKTFRIRGS